MSRHDLIHRPSLEVPRPRPLDRAAAGEWLMLLIEKAGGRQMPQFLSLRQAREYTGLSETFLRRLITAGRLVAVRDGRLKVRRSDLDAMAAADDIAEWYTGKRPMRPESDAAADAATPGE